MKNGLETNKHKDIKMLAFHGDIELKNGLLTEVEKHRIADQIIGGTYGRKDSDDIWKGCAVGCSIRSFNILRGESEDTSNHEAYPRLFGIPRILAKLEDCIFEGLPIEDKPSWPGKFFNAIRPGADLSGVWPKFAIWLLVDADHGVIRYATSDASKTAIERVAELYRTNGTKEQFIEARKQARSAAAAAAAADADAAYAAYAAAAAAAAADAAADAAAADAADADAAYVAAAADAAYVAAAAAADAAAYAWRTARQKAFKSQSEQLLKLLAEA